MAKPCAVIGLEDAVSYRTPAPVSAMRRIRFISGVTSFPVCPRCMATLNREYQYYCDRCGQALDWKGYSKAVVILYP